MDKRQDRSICLNLKLFFSETASESEELELLQGGVKRKFGPFNRQNYLKWYALGLYSLTSFCQTIVWNTWSPIASSALFAFPSWKESTIALLNNWGSITCLVFIAPCCWMLKEKGLRFSFVLATFFSMFGSGIRLMTREEDLFSYHVHIGAILNALGGVILSPAAVQLSSTWFPPHQRTFATGIGTSLSLLGMAGSYMMGLFVVNEPPLNKYDGSSEQNLIRHQITLLLVIEFVMELTLFILVFVTFPNKPLIPPSKSSILRLGQEASFLSSIKETLSNSEFWKISLANGLGNGISGPWMSLLTIIFAQTGITQNETEKLGFWIIVSSCLMGLVVGKISDLKPGNLRGLLISLLSFSDLMFVWILLFTTGAIAYGKGVLAFFVIGGLSLLWASTALYYELAAELNYPINEEIVAGCMMAVSNLCSCVVYMQLYIFSQTDVSWMNYALVIFGAIAVALLVCTKPDYKRLYIDNPP